MERTVAMLVLFCPLVVSQSGDDDVPDGGLLCSSVLSFEFNSLTCWNDDESIREVKLAELCWEEKECTNATNGPHDFIFANLSVWKKYKLHVHRGKTVTNYTINLSQKDLPLGEVNCTSTISPNSLAKLHCLFVEKPITPYKELRFATICMSMTCISATPGPQHFTFKNLKTLLNYKLLAQFDGEGVIEKSITLSKYVQIPAPEIRLATYQKASETGFVWFEHNHDFVKKPKFQVEIFSDSPEIQPKQFTVRYRNFTISKDSLDGAGVYSVRVRAKPVDYFDGMWSTWSASSSFTIKNEDKQDTVLIVIVIISAILLCFFGWISVKKNQIKDYIKPNIPHPKTTLTHIHRASEGLPFIFSPEIFSDVFIHHVDCEDEKPPAPELQDDLKEIFYSQAGSADSWPTHTKAIPEEQSHLKIRLFNESSIIKERPGREGHEEPTGQECKDEAYVTMSSLFRTQ